MINYDEQRYQAAIKKVENFIELALNANKEIVKYLLMSDILIGTGGMNVSLGGEEHNIYVVMDGIYDYAEKSFALPQFLGASCIYVYMDYNKEASTRAIIEEAWRLGKKSGSTQSFR